ncbi:MAG: TRAP transporter fused permease subunit [Rhizobiaceae bacterium]|nr:TRAP transporter fused permease subunit [Rhizobiaceae bacterium]MCV0405637.1 TRAP transporter fused permease subunit [Rhizobiaceae bacterium]
MPGANSSDAGNTWRIGDLLRPAMRMLGAAIALLGIYIAGVGVLDETLLRVGVFALGGILLILEAIHQRLGQAGWKLAAIAVDLVLLAGLVLAVTRYMQIGEALQIGLYMFTTRDLVIGTIGLVVLLELTRRAMGLPLFLICLLGLAYAVFGDALPGIFRHGGFSFQQVLQVTWYSFDGVFGGPLSVVVSLILVFIVFGVLLEGIGAGAVLLKFAFALTGRTRGGPAHAAIAASGAFGTMSGSVAGNVVGTGVITIPMIRERGFPARYAGGIEAAASSGGQFMPPVMGAVAFIMADVTGIPYLTICLAALVPALFYYLALFVAVHLEAVKRDIRPIPKAERPELTAHDYLMSLCFIVPLGVVVALLVMGRSPALAGFYAVATALVLGFAFNPDLRRNPRRVLTALANAGSAASQIVIAVGAIGILIGVMNMTGLGLRFAGVILEVAGNSLFLALVMMMLGSLVLGMGMPTVPAYLIIVLVMGPAIERLGVPTVIAHLFVVYFGVLSAITPPVAIAAFVAAPIARANPILIGLDAVKVALIGFVIPFVMVYNPSFVLVTTDFTWTGFAWVSARLLLAIWMFSTGFSGYAAGRLGPSTRALRLALGFGVLVPWLSVEAACFTLIALIVARDVMPVLAQSAGAGKRHLEKAGGDL